MAGESPSSGRSMSKRTVGATLDRSRISQRLRGNQRLPELTEHGKTVKSVPIWLDTTSFAACVAVVGHNFRALARQLWTPGSRVLTSCFGVGEMSSTDLLQRHDLQLNRELETRWSIGPLERKCRLGGEVSRRAARSTYIETCQRHIETEIHRGKALGPWKAGTLSMLCSRASIAGLSLSP